MSSNQAAPVPHPVAEAKTPIDTVETCAEGTTSFFPGSSDVVVSGARQHFSRADHGDSDGGSIGSNRLPLLDARFTHVYTHQYGICVHPQPHAVLRVNDLLGRCISVSWFSWLFSLSSPRWCR